ncbi:hypothetical protein [Streptomyces sp. NPDC002082]|uniref:hypothetical protein n=1 Tax=Streptomyces sp. NPDC002082 TaxID=3154772 RepID=UPI003332B4CF
MRAPTPRAPLTVTGAALALTLVLTGCTSDPAPTSERAAADAYIAALNSKNTQALRALAPPGNDAEADAADRIARLGGRGLRLQTVDIQHDFGPDTASARLTTVTADGSVAEHRLVLTRTKGGRWCIALGHNPKATTKTRSSTEKPPP